MKHLIIILAMVCLLFSIAVGQEYQNPIDAVKKTNFLVYVSRNFVFDVRNEIAIGVPLHDDNFYWSFYLLGDPGVRIEYRFMEFSIIGIAWRDHYVSNYPVFSWGVKAFKHLRFGTMFYPDKYMGFELVFSVN